MGRLSRRITSVGNGETIVVGILGIGGDGTEFAQFLFSKSFLSFKG